MREHPRPRSRPDPDYGTRLDDPAAVAAARAEARARPPAATLSKGRRLCLTPSSSALLKAEGEASVQIAFRPPEDGGDGVLRLYPVKAVEDEVCVRKVIANPGGMDQISMTGPRFESLRSRRRFSARWNDARGCLEIFTREDNA